jgi:hypothetical protein
MGFSIADRGGRRVPSPPQKYQPPIRPLFFLQRLLLSADLAGLLAKRKIRRGPRKKSTFRGPRRSCPAGPAQWVRSAGNLACKLGAWFFPVQLCYVGEWSKGADEVMMTGTPCLLGLVSLKSLDRWKRPFWVKRLWRMHCLVWFGEGDKHKPL